jgi:predicted MFS family arabinose efflux permease
MTSTSTVDTTAPERPRERLLTPAFVRLAVADLAYFTAAGVAIFALPLYVTGPVGSNKAGAGLAFGAFAVTALILRPFAGRLSDDRGRRPLLVGGALLCAVAMLLTAYVDALAPVVALRLTLGVAEAAFFVASFAALADLAPPSRLGEALSYNSLGLYLGLALGPLLGEALVETWGFTAAWYGAAVLSLMAAAVVLAIGETRPDRPATTERAPLIHRKAVLPALGFFSSIVAMAGFLAYASLHAQSVGLTRASLPLFVYGMVVVVGRIAFARIPDRLPPLQLGATALVTIALGLTVAALWATPLGMLTGTVLLGLGVTFSTPAFFTAVFASVKPSERGSASGTASAFLDLGLGGGPIVLGLVAEAAGIPWVFGVAAGVALAGAAWTISLARLRPLPATAAP